MGWGATLWRVSHATPRPLFKGLTRCAEKLHYHLDGRHMEECRRMVAWAGLERADEVTRGMLRHLWDMYPELLDALDQMDSLLDRVEGFEELAAKAREALSRGGLIWAGAHLGHWELCGLLIQRHVAPVLTAYKPHARAWVEEFMLCLRRETGQTLVAKEGALVPMLRCLKGGGSVGLLLDQHAGPGGVASTFMGRPCRSWNTYARLAARAGASILPVTLVRSGAGRYKVLSGPVLRPASGEDAMLECVHRVDSALSEMVSAYPEQWLWLGRRWGRDFDKKGGP